MARFFTSDWHINGTVFIEKKLRPFSTVEKMNNFILTCANQRAKLETDQIIHIGDLKQEGKDHGLKSNNPMTYKDIRNTLVSNLVCLTGNHDINNKVPTIATSIRTALKKSFNSVVCCHYPSIDIRAKGHFCEYDILLHGHAHKGVYDSKKIIFYDYKNKVLNFNVCADLHNYQIWTEREIIDKLIEFLKTHTTTFNK